jgi:hypothetical protein
MSMFVDIFAALFAVSAAVVWLSTRGERMVNGPSHEKDSFTRSKA